MHQETSETTVRQNTQSIILTSKNFFAVTSDNSYEGKIVCLTPPNCAVQSGRNWLNSDNKSS